MKRKFLISLLTLCLTLFGVFMFSGCDDCDHHAKISLTKIPTYEETGECYCFGCKKTMTLPTLNDTDYTKNDNSDYEIYVYTFDKDTKLTIVGRCNFIIDNAGDKITGYVGNNANVIIPSVVYERLVYEDSDVGSYYANIPRKLRYIAESAFKDCTSIKSINFESESDVHSIEQYAFDGCTNLTEIHLPDSVSTIGEYAFQNTALEELVLPQKVYPYNVLKGCNTLRKLTLSRLFEDFSSALGGEVPDSLKEVVLNESAVCDFSGCDKIEKITLLGGTPSGIYNGCTSLKEVTLSSSVTVIEENTFENCSSLTDIVLPAAVTNITIRSGALKNCNADAYYLGSKSDITVRDEDEVVTFYYYSETAPNGVEFLNNKKVVDTWHYGDNGEKTLWQPNFTANVSNKTFNYVNSTVALSDTYWAVLKEAEKQGMLGELFDGDQAQIDAVTSSNTKEEYEGKMADYYASVAIPSATSVTFANDKLTLHTAVGSGELEYIEVDGEVCCKAGGTAKVLFTYSNDAIYEELSNEYYTIRHNYTLAN